MPLDLDALGDGTAPRHLDPRDIYAALPTRPWPYLRHEQGEVLERWFGRRDQRDLVIRQNTGGGKTVVGLLACQSTLNEQVGPAVYIASDSYLVAQTVAEASRLGLRTTTDARDQAFADGEAILVVTLQKLINGRTVFGVAGTGRDVLDLGIVVVDDAHAALTTAEGQFRLSVPVAHPAYDGLVDLFADALEGQSRTRWADLKAEDPGVTMRVPFWTWQDRQNHVVDILHPHRNDDELKFVWPLVQDVLPLCHATVTASLVELRPPCPPISQVPSFANARRRVYLTATLADDSVLVTGLDADPTTISRPVTPGRAADLGDRLILAPAELNPRLSDEAVRVLARQLADEHNVVVLVPSTAAAGRWADYADEVLHVRDLEAGVARLRAGHVGLVVLVNKYDGVDLPGDACRVLVVDGLPRALDPGERRDAAVLHRSPVLAARQVQRVEQGMGRGVRDAEDWCAVLLIGDDLARTVSLRSNRPLFSPATAAQLDLSHRVAKQIEDEGIDAVRAAVDACLTRDPGWVKAARAALADVRYAEDDAPRPDAVAQRRAFDRAAAGRHRDAAELIRQAADDSKDRAVAGWLREQQAAYLHPVDAPAAQAVLAKAVAENNLLLHPAEGVDFRPLRPLANQAAAAAKYLAETYDDGVSLALGVRELVSRIDWDPDRTDDAEEAWREFGLHLGLPSTRPEQEYGVGPDNLWGLTGNRHAVAELKTGAKADTISKSDLDQLGGSVRWDVEHHGGETTQIPVLLHPSAVHDTNATPPDGTRVVTAAKLDELKKAVVAYAVALADGRGRWRDENAVGGQLSHYGLDSGTVIPKYSETPRPHRPGR